MARNESVLVILDTSKSMFSPYMTTEENEEDKNKSNLDIAKEAVLMLYQQKLLYAGKSHHVGLLTYSGDSVKIQQDFQNVSIEMVKQFRDITNGIKEPSSQNGDPFLALSTGPKTITDVFKKRKFRHKIFFITSLMGQSVYSQKDISKLCQVIKEMDIKINIILFDPDNSVGDKYKQQNRKYLEQIEQECQDSVQIFDAADAMFIYRELQKKIFNLTTKYRGSLEISPELKIGVMAYTKSNDQKVPSLKKYSMVSQFDKDQKSNSIVNQSIQFIYDDPEMKPVDPQNVIRGFEYGNEIIPIPKEHEQDLKVRDDDRCLKILGFCAKKNIPRHHYMSGADMVVPTIGEENTLAFNAIVKSLIESGKMGVARFTMRKNSPPKLVALHPEFNEQIGYVLYIIQIPTAEDLREYSFASLEKSSESQQAKVGQLIERMNLVQQAEGEQNEENEESELAKPENMFNPILQHLNQVLLDRAFDITTDIREINSKVLQELYPDKITEANANDLFQQIKEEFGLKELQVNEKDAKRLFWREIASKQREEIEKNLAEGAETETVQNKKTDFGDSDYIREISTLQPISDFKEMLNNKKVDLTGEAISQMKEVIVKMVDESLQVQHIFKSIECLQALRQGCIDEDETENFNQFMLDLQIKFLNSSKRNFLEILVRKGIGLISKSESRDSMIENQAAKEFLLELQLKLDEGANIKPIDEDGDEEMLLDLE